MNEVDQKLVSLAQTWRQSEKRLERLGKPTDEDVLSKFILILQTVSEASDPVSKMKEIIETVRPGYEALKELRLRLCDLDIVSTQNRYLRKHLKNLREGASSVENWRVALALFHALLWVAPETWKDPDPEAFRFSDLAQRLQTRFKEEKSVLCSDLAEMLGLESETSGSTGLPQDLEEEVLDLAYAARETLDPDLYLAHLFALLRDVPVDQYRQRTQKLGVLVVRRSLPDTVRHHLGLIRKAYQRGLDEVAVVFCRAVLEAVLRHEVLRLTSRRRETGDRQRNFWTFKGLVDDAQRLDVISREQATRCRQIGEAAGSILHPGGWHDDRAKDAFWVIEETFAVVERIYR